MQQRYSLPIEVPQETLEYLTNPPPPPLPIPTKGKRSASQIHQTLLACHALQVTVHRHISKGQGSAFTFAYAAQLEQWSLVK